MTSDFPAIVDACVAQSGDDPDLNNVPAIEPGVGPPWRLHLEGVISNQWCRYGAL